MDKDQIVTLEKGALALLQKKAKADVQIFQKDVDTVPSTGKPVFRFGALNANNPEKSRVQIVLDETGAEVDPKALSDREGKVIFGGDYWPWRQYSYSVKYVYGTQPAADGCCCLPGVRTGIYATEINIHNYQAYSWHGSRSRCCP